MHRLARADDFFELGGDSLLAAAIFARVEAEFGQRLAPETLLSVQQYANWQTFCRNPKPRSPRRFPCGFAPDSASRPCSACRVLAATCLSSASSPANCAEPRAVYGLRPAGLDDDLEPHDSIPAMASLLRSARCAVQPQGPYALCGYSLGGNVAFEMARQLQAAGEKVALLALLDSRLWSPSVRLGLWQKLQLHWQNLYHSMHVADCTTCASGLGCWQREFAAEIFARPKTTSCSVLACRPPAATWLDITGEPVSINLARTAAMCCCSWPSVIPTWRRPPTATTQPWDGRSGPDSKSTSA